MHLESIPELGAEDTIELSGGMAAAASGESRKWTSAANAKYHAMQLPSRIAAAVIGGLMRWEPASLLLESFVATRISVRSGLQWSLSGRCGRGISPGGHFVSFVSHAPGTDASRACCAARRPRGGPTLAPHGCASDDACSTSPHTGSRTRREERWQCPHWSLICSRRLRNTPTELSLANVS
jgi:hypothetical protein